jgi:hypothetical protein
MSCLSPLRESNDDEKGHANEKKHITLPGGIEKQQHSKYTGYRPFSGAERSQIITAAEYL